MGQEFPIIMVWIRNQDLLFKVLYILGRPPVKHGVLAVYQKLMPDIALNWHQDPQRNENLLRLRV